MDSLLYGQDVVTTTTTTTATASSTTATSSTITATASTTSLNAKTTNSPDEKKNDNVNDIDESAKKAVDLKSSAANATVPSTLSSATTLPPSPSVTPTISTAPPAPSSPPPPPSTSVTTFSTPTSAATATSSTTASTTTRTTADAAIAITEPVGIGGKGGLVYDVNRLKRNLLQETLRAYKRELWDLLSSPTSNEEEIVNKLAALVQASPVSTTTDSNLLDGDWVLAYQSKQCASSVLLDPRRFARTNRLKRKSDTSSAVLSTERVKLPSPFQGMKGGIFRTFLRTYTLEDVDDPRAPYIVDTWRLLGGLALEKRVYSLTGLSRSSLDLDLTSKEWYVLGGGDRSIHNVTYPMLERPRVQVQVVYSDVDLCITSEDGGPDSPFLVFTKNEAWLHRQQRFRRKVRFVMNGLEQVVKLVLPIEWMQRRFLSFSFSNTLDRPRDSSKILLQVRQGNSSVRVLKLGSTSSMEEEDDKVAWDGDMDPFVHMSADERQDQLRAMNVRQIDQAQRKQQRKTRRERLVKWLVRRKTFFRKPE